MTRLAALLLVALAVPVGAQRATIGAQLAFADYMEQGSTLHFSGAGPAASASVSWRRFGVHVGAIRLSLRPTAAADGAESFTMTQMDLRLRARVARNVSVEAGVMDRNVDPSRAAQAVGALRLGALLSFPLAVGSDLAVRASYVGASNFSGGGSAPLGLELGLGASYGPRSGRLRGSAEFEFQRIDRTTRAGGSRAEAPLQSSVLKVGVGYWY